MAGSLLISRIPVRYHDLALLTAFLRAHGSMSYPQLTEHLTPDWQYYLTSSGALLKETIGFGATLGLFQLSVSRSWEDRLISVLPADGPFALQVLQLLNQQSEPSQRAFKEVHSSLIEQGLFYTSIQEIVQHMEVSAYAGLFAWNTTKINFWAQFMHDLGLIVRLPPERLALSPSSDLLTALIAQSPLQRAELRSLLGGWHEQYFAVFTRLGEVHEGLSRALLRLESAGDICLTYASDSTGSVLLSGRRVSHVERSAPCGVH